MNNIIALNTLLLGLVVFNSCNDQEPEPEPEIEETYELNLEYIIFGHFYGYCHGESCIEIFKLTAFGLYEDENDQYPWGGKRTEKSFVRLDQSKFDKMKYINFAIPDKLSQEENKIIGHPDRTDGGGIYLELPDERVWLIDNDMRLLPEYLHPLREQIIEAISKINE